MTDFLDTAPCYFLKFSVDGTLLFINDTLCKALGYEKKELTGFHINEILTVSTKIFLQTHWLPMLTLEGFANELYITFRTRKKTKLSVLLNSLKKEQNNFIEIECVGILSTNRQQYEQELKDAKKAYEAELITNTAFVNSEALLQQRTEELNLSVNRLKLQIQEMGQVNKVITHDLQEPIRKLLFYTDQNNDADGNILPLTTHEFQRIRRIAKKLQLLLSGVQQYLWITEGEPDLGVVDLDKLLDKAKLEISNRFPDLSINYEIESLPSVHGDEDLVYTMLLQVLDNAVQFRSPERNPTIKISGRFVEENTLKHLSNRFRYHKKVRIFITDNGSGLEDEGRDEIFRLLFRSSRSTGIGIGLAIARKICEYLGGSISAERESRQGTTIIITLPTGELIHDEDITY